MAGTDRTTYSSLHKTFEKPAFRSFCPPVMTFQLMCHILLSWSDFSLPVSGHLSENWTPFTSRKPISNEVGKKEGHSLVKRSLSSHICTWGALFCNNCWFYTEAKEGRSQACDWVASWTQCINDTNILASRCSVQKYPLSPLRSQPYHYSFTQHNWNKWSEITGSPQQWWHIYFNIFLFY